jgi:hypothetical protein
MSSDKFGDYNKNIKIINNSKIKVYKQPEKTFDNNKIGNYQQAIKVVAAELKKDKSGGSTYYNWQSNIACIIQDLSNNKIDHELSNEICRFLDRLIGAGE